MKTFYAVCKAGNPATIGHYVIKAYDDEAAWDLAPDNSAMYSTLPAGHPICHGKITERTVIAIDIETDGLEHKGGQILEVCMHRLDGRLNILGTFEGVLPFNIENFSDLIMEMHTKNGLIDAVPTIMAAEVVDWLSQFENIIWLGSSVGFDARWMREHFPETKCSHRVIDTSSLKGLVDLTDRLPERESNHRAADDIAYSLDVARLYRDVLEAGVL